MKLAMFEKDGRIGLAAGDGKVFNGLTEADSGYPGDLDRLMASGADLAAVGKALQSAPAVDLAKVRLLPPLRKPGKIVCVGVNYKDHAEESGHSPTALYPEIFARFASSLIGAGAPIIKPAASDQVDYEGELVVVIGKAGRNVPKSKALEHVAAYSVFNDVSIRDFQMRVTQWVMGKNFDDSGPFGPWLTTADELPPGAAGLRLTTRLNGQVLQDANTKDLIFDVATLIEFLTQGMTLNPGDIIITGTPGGVGVSRKPQVFMKAGDRCEIEIEGVGLLSNPVA
ncbi:MAG: fumarylacetoacetate hydrolase family protein [Candidatus Adiutrix sp.]|jgi:2-keto-4-pentenoate hydratase/2-oxohepta-3-ene-1,7-dioic acid hydratase in catechol pathway|nr:fumarylacetoacetate hydrolase family protein [Candidatus Adiutrix sp.]